MLLSSFFARSMAFTHTPRVQLPFALFSETFLTIRQNSLYVTVCIIARPSYRGYFIHSLSTLYYYNAPSLTTRLTGDYRDRTYTGKCSPALLDTRKKTRACEKTFVFSHALPIHLFYFSNRYISINPLAQSVRRYSPYACKLHSPDQSLHCRIRRNYVQEVPSGHMHLLDT